MRCGAARGEGEWRESAGLCIPGLKPGVTDMAPRWGAEREERGMGAYYPPRVGNPGVPNVQPLRGAERRL